MAKPLSKERAEEILSGEDNEAIRKALKRLPDDIDPSLVCDGMMPIMGNSWSFARCYDAMPASVIREFTSRIAPIARRTGCSHRDVAILVSTIVSSSSSDAKLIEQWQLALRTLLDLDLTYGWGSKKRKERFVALANNPIVLRAIRTVAVACANPDLDVLAVLAADGSDDSVDALMPTLMPLRTTARVCSSSPDCELTPTRARRGCKRSSIVSISDFSSAAQTRPQSR